MFRTRQILANSIAILVMVSPIVFSALPAAAQLDPVTGASNTNMVVQATTDDQTITLSPGAMSPSIVQVNTSDEVTFTNNDSQTRTIELIYEDEVTTSAELFLPLVVKGNSSTVQQQPIGNSNPASVLQESQTTETITLSPGESTSRNFSTPNNIVARDTSDSSLTSTILVIQAPLPQQGPVLGKIIDYSTKQPIAGAQVRTLEGSFATTTNVDGTFNLNLPPGDHNVVLFANGYSFANRIIKMRPFTPASVEIIELVPLDSNVTPIDNAGGIAENFIGNTSVEFAAGAVTSTKAIRLTDLPVDEFASDFAALPGPFTNGRIPLGFVMFEPDGTQFSADAVWTIEYDGPLPVGTYVPCFYWIEEEARWGEPVDGEVVDLGNGNKGLRATLPHFSSYGFAAAPPPEPQPPQFSDVANIPDLDDPSGPEDNPNESDLDQCMGSQVNMASGELCQTVGTLALPTVGGLPSQVTASYFSRDINYQAEISTTLQPASGSPAPDYVGYRVAVAGQGSSENSSTVSYMWPGRGANNQPMAPGRYMATVTGIYGFSVTSAGGGTGGTFPMSCGGSCGMSYFETETEWPVSNVRNDLSPFGIGWFSPHDTLLVDASDWVTIVQGNGRQVVFVREGGGNYSTPPAENSNLVMNGDGSWTRTYRDGSVMSFNADGRLTELSDRYGNAQQIFYESNGKTFPAGQWGLTSRIRRIVDSSGNYFNFSYSEDGWLKDITDSTGRASAFEHDSSGHLTAFIDPLGQREEFAYDNRSMMTSHMDKRGSTTEYELDDVGRVLSRTWPTGTTLTASYTESETAMTTDNGSPIVTTLDENGSAIAQYNGVFTVHMSYDDNLRPTSRDLPNTILIYDENGYLIESVSDAHSLYERNAPYEQVSRLTTSSGQDTHFGYDSQGSMTMITDVLGQTYTMAYDSHGQPTSITDPLGNTTTYQYDSRGLVTAITDPLGRSWQMAYDAAGNLINLTSPKGDVSTMTYDDLNRLIQSIDMLGGMTQLAYDANSNLTQVTDPTGRAISYAYDSLDRVVGVTYPGGSSEQINYDGSSNPTSIIDPRGQQTQYTYDAANRPMNIDVTNDGAYAYTYDHLSQPTSITMTSDDGIELLTDIRYIDGVYGYPLQSHQVSNNLPLTATVEYSYGGFGDIGGNPYTVDESPEMLFNNYLSQNGLTWPDTPPSVSCAQILPGVITQTQTLTNTTGAYCFGNSGGASTTRIETGVSVTFGPGVTIAGYSDAVLEIQGTLVLSGTADNPISITNVNGSGVDSYQILGSSSGEIIFNYVEHWYGGYCTVYNCGNPGIYLTNNSHATIRNSHLGLDRGSIKLFYARDDTTLSIHDSTFANPDVINSIGTFHVDSTAIMTATNNLFMQMGNQSNISDKGVKVNERNVAPLLSGGNTFVPSEDQLSRIYVTTTPTVGMTQDALWKGLDHSPGLEGLYFYFMYLQVWGGATLTIEGPQDIQPWYGLNAGNGTDTGHIRLIGTLDAPVRINRPNGQYRGVTVHQGSSLYAEHAILGYSTANGNVFVTGSGANAILKNVQILNSTVDGFLVADQGSITIEDTLIMNNVGYGLRHWYSGSEISVVNSAFIDNGGGINNQQPQYLAIDAEFNYWGAGNGPDHSTNPNGTGQAVTDGVDFYPWLATPGDGNLTRIDLTSNDNPTQSMSYQYDPLGQVTAFMNSGYAEYGAVYEYDARGHLESRTPLFGLPLTESLTYDDAGQLANLEVSTTGGSILSQSYSYDPNGNMTQIDSNLDGILGYSYDQMNQLVIFNDGGANSIYAYDAAGNRTSANDINYTYNAAGQLVSSTDGVTYNYDAAGNLTSRTQGGQTTTYTWNGGSQLVRIDYPNGTFSAYRYDDAGHRISRRLPDGTARYYTYIGDMLAQELDESGQVVASYTYNSLDRPVSLWRDGETFYYVLDHLGSVRALVDSNGVITATYQYDPWGHHLNTTGTVENPLRFAGREYDSESGLFYNRFRYYDPEVGRFISRDPIGISGGINLYAYASNNPVTMRDPYGMTPESDWVDESGFSDELFGGDGMCQEFDSDTDQMSRIRYRVIKIESIHISRNVWILEKIGGYDLYEWLSDLVGGEKRFQVPVETMGGPRG